VIGLGWFEDQIALQRQGPHRPRHRRGRGSACAVALSQAGAEVWLAEALRAMLLELHKARQAKLGRAALRPPRRTRRAAFMGFSSKMRLARPTAVHKPVILGGCDKNAICSKEGGKKGTVNRRFRCLA